MIKIDAKENKIILSGNKTVLLDDFANIASNLFELAGTDAVVDALCKAYERYIDSNETDSDFIL